MPLTPTGSVVRPVHEVLGADAVGAYLHGPARLVERTLVVRGGVRPWRCPPRQEFRYGERLRDAYESGTTPSPVPDPGPAPLITMVLRGERAAARAATGRAPAPFRPRTSAARSPPVCPSRSPE